MFARKWVAACAAMTKALLLRWVAAFAAMTVAVRCSFNILRLLAHPLQLFLQLNHFAQDLNVCTLAADRIHLAQHFLQEKSESLSDWFASGFVTQCFTKTAEMGTQPAQFFRDVRAIGEYRNLLCNALF